ncbi:unnamed protein product [Amoebophrya sp. A25]|nr:unnamed protein product [Amoebophrya sp. A25]|eukprot:GSA25T00022884001.1
MSSPVQQEAPVTQGLGVQPRSSVDLNHTEPTAAMEHRSEKKEPTESQDHGAVLCRCNKPTLSPRRKNQPHSDFIEPEAFAQEAKGTLDRCFGEGILSALEYRALFWELGLDRAEVERKSGREGQGDTTRPINHRELPVDEDAGGGVCTSSSGSGRRRTLEEVASLLTEAVRRPGGIVCPVNVLDEPCSTAWLVSGSSPTESSSGTSSTESSSGSSPTESSSGTSSTESSSIGCGSKQKNKHQKQDTSSKDKPSTRVHWTVPRVRQLLRDALLKVPIQPATQKKSTQDPPRPPHDTQNPPPLPPFEVLFESDSLLCIAKKAGKRVSPIHRLAGFTSCLNEVMGYLEAKTPVGGPRHVESENENVVTDLVNSLRTTPAPQERGRLFATPLHRLDVHTSGALLFAKSPEAARIFGNPSFWSTHVRKEYLALVRVGGERQISEEQNGGEKASGPATLTCSIPLDGKACTTTVSFISTASSTKTAFLVLCELTSGGRRHQIRRHCALLGFPLVGDREYDLGFDAGYDDDEKNGVLTEEVAHPRVRDRENVDGGCTEKGHGVKNDVEGGQTDDEKNAGDLKKEELGSHDQEDVASQKRGEDGGKFFLHAWKLMVPDRLIEAPPPVEFLRKAQQLGIDMAKAHQWGIHVIPQGRLEDTAIE